MAEGDGRRTPWIARTIGAGLVVAGFVGGWVGFQAATRPFAGKPAAARPRRPTEERAVVSGDADVMTAAPGEDVELQWRVANTGQTTWTPDDYRFVPGGADLPVLPLPMRVKPGDSVTVRAEVTTPLTAGDWKVFWLLTGTDASGNDRLVTGGRLDAEVTVSDP